MLQDTLVKQLQESWRILCDECHHNPAIIALDVKGEQLLLCTDCTEEIAEAMLERAKSCLALRAKDEQGGKDVSL